MDQRHLFTGAGYNCAEAVLAALTGSRDHVSCASGFGGGIGGSGQTCGAVTGALMGMGLVLGARDPETPASYECFRSQVSRFLDSFEAEFGSTLCRELLDRPNAGNPESRCAEFVDYAAHTGREIIRRAGGRPGT
ncbi:MAG: C-GCAxxG-C-C family protein [Bacillota bacterium]